MGKVWIISFLTRHTKQYVTHDMGKVWIISFLSYHDNQLVSPYHSFSILPCTLNANLAR